MADAAVDGIVFSYATGNISYFRLMDDDASTFIKPSELGAIG